MGAAADSWPNKPRDAAHRQKESTMKAPTNGSILVASAIVAMLGSGAALSGNGDPQWKKALEARSMTLNEQYGLGVRAEPPPWLRALRLRSEALNRQYKVGQHAPRS
jgi:hypothetical protein